MYSDEVSSDEWQESTSLSVHYSKLSNLSKSFLVPLNYVRELLDCPCGDVHVTQSHWLIG